MYAIYADDQLVYDPNAVSLGYVVTAPTLTTEMNKAGSLQFNIPVTNPSYSKLFKMKTIITVRQDDVEIWRGRILNDEKDFYNTKTIFCEGELAFLNDAVVGPYDFSAGTTLGYWFHYIMNQYTNRCSDYRKIQYGQMLAADPYNNVYNKLEDYSDVMTELTDKLAASISGVFRLRRSADGTTSYLDFLDPTENISDQTITFGRNLIDLTEYVDATEVYTSILPLGKKDDNGNRVTISSINNGSPYLNSDVGIQTFGLITKAVAWEDTTDPQELKGKAQALLQQVVEMATTIEINAVDLKLLGVNASRLEVGQFVPVISPPHGINSNFLCSKIELNLQEPSRSSYTFGLVFSALTDKQIANAKKSDNAYETAQSTSEEYNALRTEVYENYVSTAEFENYQGQVNQKFEDLGALNPEDYATQEDLDNLSNVYLSQEVAEITYTKKTDFDTLEERVTQLENGGNA